MNKSELIGKLLFRHVRRELSRKEERELLAWRQLSARNEEIFQNASDPEKLRLKMAMIHEEKEETFKLLQERFPDLKQATVIKMKTRSPWVRRLAVASILIFGTYLVFHFNSDTRSGSRSHEVGFITADGVRHISSDFNRGYLTGRAGITFRWPKTGERIYIAGLNSKEPKDKLYGLIAPTGRVLPLIIPDNTSILLNTESVIRYPANFTNDSIHIYIDGEAYFEVTPQKNKFFQVIVNGMKMQTKGGHFNVTAYKEDSFSIVTALQGNIEITPASGTSFAEALAQVGHISKTISPGQQATADSGKINILDHADTTAAIAWVNNRFSFSNASIKTILHAMSRWYDIDVIYQGKIPDGKFNLMLPRTAKISEVIASLSRQGINIQVKENTIIIK